MEHYRHALDADPDAATVHLNMATLLAEGGDFAQAEIELDLAIQLDPALAGTGHRNLALVFVERGQTAEAIDELDEALRADPKLAIAHVELARLLVRQGSFDARSGNSKAIAIDPFVTGSSTTIPPLPTACWPSYCAPGTDCRGPRVGRAAKKAIRRFAKLQLERGIAKRSKANCRRRLPIFKSPSPPIPKTRRPIVNWPKSSPQGQRDEAIAHYQAARAIEPGLAAARRGLERLMNP